MAEQFLDSPDVRAGLQQMGCERVTQRVDCNWRHQADRVCCGLDRPLKLLWIQVMTPPHAGPWIDRMTF